MMKPWALVMVLAVMGCTTTDSLLLSPNEASIRVRMHPGFLSDTAIEHKTLKVAARFTLSHGYRYFIVLGAQDTTRRVGAVAPSAAAASLVAPIPPEWLQGVGHGVTIRMFAADDADAQRSAYDAEVILAN